MLGSSPLSSTPLASSLGLASVDAIVTIGGVSATASVAPVYAYFTPLIFILAGGAGYTGINITGELGSLTVTVSSVISTATDLRKPEGYAYSIIDGVGDMSPLSAPDRRYFFQLGTGNTGGISGTGPSAYEASLVEIGTFELNSDAVLSYMDNSVTLTGLSASPSLVTTNISAIVGQFRSVSGVEGVLSQGQLGNTGYHYLLKPEGVSGTVSLGVPIGKVVYLARLQTEDPYNHDQEVTVSLGAVTVAVANQGITTSNIITASLSNVATLVNAKPVLSGITEYTTFSDPSLRFQLNSLSSSTTLIGTMATSELANSSVQTQLTASFLSTASTNTDWTLNNSHPDLVAEDSLKATVSLGQLANQSSTEQVPALPITTALGLITLSSYNTLPVTGHISTVGIGSVQANVLEPLTSSFFNAVSLGVITTLATSEAVISAGLDTTLESNLTTEVTASGTAFPVGRVLSGSAGEVSVTASSTITLPPVDAVTVFYGEVRFTSIDGQYLELFFNPNVTATGVTFDYEAIKHLYNPARSSFPLLVSRAANVTEAHPRNIAA
tara:strand:+ start:918 stop:2579 length:1662 start_codon:yes stop_codon:yes gene_type:complete